MIPILGAQKALSYLTRVVVSSIFLISMTSCGSGAAFPFRDSLNATSVFMGDSITQWWGLPQHNDGIAGQTTAQMLDRFHKDILGRGFKRVVILGGTNDISLHQNLSNIPLNLEAMATMAQSSGIEVVLCTIPPIIGQNVEDQVLYVNKMIVDLARSRGYLLVDYFTVMNDHPEYFKDQVHPDRLGYLVMETALSKIVTN